MKRMGMIFALIFVLVGCSSANAGEDMAAEVLYENIEYEPLKDEAESNDNLVLSYLDDKGLIASGNNDQQAEETSEESIKMVQVDDSYDFPVVQFSRVNKENNEQPDNGIADTLTLKKSINEGTKLALLQFARSGSTTKYNHYLILVPFPEESEEIDKFVEDYDRLEIDNDIIENASGIFDFSNKYGGFRRIGRIHQLREDQN